MSKAPDIPIAKLRRQVHRMIVRGRPVCLFLGPDGFRTAGPDSDRYRRFLRNHTLVGTYDRYVRPEWVAEDLVACGARVVS